MKQEVTPIDGFHYSTNEQFTGKYWIDGKKIYSKTFVDTLPSTSTDGVIGSKEITIGNNIGNAWLCQGFAVDANSYKVPLPIYLTAVGLQLKLYITPSNKLGITNTVVSYSNQPFNITIEYTKTTD